MPRVDAIAPQSLSTKALQPQRTEMGRDAFLKLLTMQLRLQNPVRPYDGQELAAQRRCSRNWSSSSPCGS